MIWLAMMCFFSVFGPLTGAFLIMALFGFWILYCGPWSFSIGGVVGLWKNIPVVPRLRLDLDLCLGLGEGPWQCLSFPAASQEVFFCLVVAVPPPCRRSCSSRASWTGMVVRDCQPFRAQFKGGSGCRHGGSKLDFVGDPVVSSWAPQFCQRFESGSITLEVSCSWGSLCSSQSVWHRGSLRCDAFEFLSSKAPPSQFCCSYIRHSSAPGSGACDWKCLGYCGDDVWDSQ